MHLLFLLSLLMPGISIFAAAVIPYVRTVNPIRLELNNNIAQLNESTNITALSQPPPINLPDRISFVDVIYDGV